MILFLPQCGVFYCARERRSADVGVLKTLVALDMSWLRLLRLTDERGEVTYTFDEGGYVKQLSYRVVQCLDCDGHMMAPDVYAGERTIAWPHADLVEEYNGCLARANSARKDGRHYVPGCHHFQLPDTCWIIDPTVTHCVDIMADLAT